MDILLSTSNKQKVEFIKIAASGLGIVFHTPKELGLCLDVEENGITAVDNAIIKARALSTLSGMPTFAWDMGMRIEKLPENLQPNLHIRRPLGNEELSDADMVEFWRDVVEKNCDSGESVARYFDGVAIMDGQKLVSSMSFNEDPFIFSSKENKNGFARFNVFDRVRKTFDGKYFCDISENEYVKYEASRKNNLRMFFEEALEKLEEKE